MLDRLSILIPTKDRIVKLHKALAYYERHKFPGHLIICDSSSDRSKLQRLCDMYKVHSTIVECPQEYHPGAAIARGNEFITTPYAMYHGDDDVGVLGGLESCITFLDENPDFTAANGLRGTKVQIGISPTMYYTQQVDLLEEEPEFRLSLYLQKRTALDYCVHRTDIWKLMYKDSASVKNRWLGGEVLPCCISAIHGRVRGFNFGTVFRTDSGDSLTTGYDSLFSTCFSEEYVTSLSKVRELIIAALVECGVEQQRAINTWDTNIWLSTIYMLINKFVEHYPSGLEFVQRYAESLDTYLFNWKKKLMNTEVELYLRPEFAEHYRDF